MKFIFSLLAFLIFSSTALSAEFPADWAFQTLRTPHFDIIVNAKQQDLGRFYARKLEKARALLARHFTDVPERVTIVLADKTDLTNGYATRLPYPHMFFFPVLPGPQESIGETGDWALELALHELTHILTFEATSGVMEPLQSVFGTILSPNLLLPTWWKEGVAVQTETQFSHGGRLRSAYQDGVLRTLFADRSADRFDLASINERLPFWTEGMSAYLFGSVFWNQAVSEKGTRVIDDLHQAHGGRVPYAVNKPAKTFLGLPYGPFYEKAVHETERRVLEQLEVLRQTPLVEGDDLQIKTMYAQGPRVSPSGHYLALIGVDETDRRSIRIFQKNPQRHDFVSPTEDLRFINRRENDLQPATPDAPPSGSISRVSWFPKKNRLVFDKVDWVSSYESYSDLWIFDADKARSERLTRGLRAREPFVSRDETKIFFVRLDGSRTALAAYDLAKKTSHVLWQGGWQDRISFPVELPDGSLIFALRNEEGWEGLRRLRPGSDSPEVVLDDFPDARFPEWGPRGLMFTSSLNGVHNLYLASPDYLTATPLTHVKGGVYSSTMDPRTQDVYITSMTSQGPQVRLVSRSFSDELPGTLPKVEGLFADRLPKPDRPQPDPDVPVQVQPYSPGSYLLPRYWIPFVSLSAVNNSLVLDASTAGFDPLKKHIYALAVGWDSGVKELSYLASYQNNVTAHSIGLSAYRSSSYLVSTENILIDEGQSLSFTPDVFKLSRYLAVSLGAQNKRTTYFTSEAERWGPSLVVQYADFGKSGRQISPEEGGHLLLGAFHYLPGGDRLSYTQYLGSASYFWSRWLPKRHAVALKLNSTYTPDPLPALFGASTTNYFQIQDTSVPQYVVRGYDVGSFFGKTLNTANLEYRFPITDIYSGSGTTPFYFSRLHGAVYVDAVSVEGAAYRPKEDAFESVRSNRTFGTVGAEGRLETTLGYLIPLNFIMGYAVPLSPAHSNGPGITFALQLGALF